MGWALLALMGARRAGAGDSGLGASRGGTRSVTSASRRRGARCGSLRRRQRVFLGETAPGAPGARRRGVSLRADASGTRREPAGAAEPRAGQRQGRESRQASGRTSRSLRVPARSLRQRMAPPSCTLPSHLSAQTRARSCHRGRLGVVRCCCSSAPPELWQGAHEKGSRMSRTLTWLKEMRHQTAGRTEPRRWPAGSCP